MTVRIIGGGGPGSHPELAQNVGNVVFDGARAQEEAVGDILVRLAGRDQAEHFALAGCQFQTGRGRRIAGVAGGAARGVLLVLIAQARNIRGA